MAASMRERLRRLETARQAKALSVEPSRQAQFERLFELIENGRADLEGLPPPHDVPYEPPDPEIISMFRFQPGWQSEQGLWILDQWEQELKEYESRRRDDVRC